MISRSITYIPKIPSSEDAKKNELTIVKNRRIHKRNKEYTSQINKDTLNHTGIEDIIWAKIEDDLLADDKKNLLEHCKTYMKICDQYISTTCKHIEDVLFYQIQLSFNDEKDKLIEQYKDQFPEGKYTNKLQEYQSSIEIPIPPIIDGLAHLDYDKNVLIVNRVQGGEKPYYVGFFDINKSKEYAIKRIRFNKESNLIKINTLGIPEGNYQVKVMDAREKPFVEKTGIYVSNDFRIPKSIKLSILLVFVGSLGFLYKKYIYF